MVIPGTADDTTEPDMNSSTEDFRNLYRFYHIFIRKPSDATSTKQLYVMKDFTIDDNDDIDIIKLSYVAVVLLKVFVSNKIPLHSGAKLVSTCTACSSAANLSHYLMSDWDNEPFSETLPEELISCRHVAAVMSDITHTLCPYLLECVTINFKTDLIRELLFLLDSSPETMVLGHWITPDWRYPTPKGSLMIYLTDVGVLVIAAIATSNSNSNYFHCFQCPYTRHCSHTTQLPNAILQGETNERQDSTSNAQDFQTSEFDTVLVSTIGYPFDIREDEELCNHICRRKTVGIRSWLAERFPSNVLRPEISVCCDHASATRIPSAPGQGFEVVLFHVGIHN